MVLTLPSSIIPGVVRRHSYLFEETVNPITLEHTIAEAGNDALAFEADAALGWNPGSAEPWIADLVASLVVASHATDVLEIGGFEGFTSKRLARALNTLRRGTLTVVEIDIARADAVQLALDILRLPFVRHRVVAGDSLRYISTLPDESLDLVWVDGDHRKEQVRAELTALLPKMRANGLICGHDVFGICDLAEVFRAFGGYALDLPRLGPAGGLGIVQVL